jgi:hypothetical protein
VALHLVPIIEPEIGANSMPYVQGFLIEGPVDPGFGRPGGGGPVDPGFGGGSPNHPWIPGHLPDPPPSVWPPPTVSHPIQPAPPGTPPGAIYPPPNAPSHPIAGQPGVPTHPVQPPAGATPGHPDQGLPSNTFWVVAGIPGVGWRYVCVDPSLVAGTPLPPAPAPKG